MKIQNGKSLIELRILAQHVIHEAKWNNRPVTLSIDDEGYVYISITDRPDTRRDRILQDRNPHWLVGVFNAACEHNVIIEALQARCAEIKAAA